MEYEAWSSILRGESYQISPDMPDARTCGDAAAEPSVPRQPALSGSFLADIVTSTELSSKVPPTGVRIVGACFLELVNLSGLHLPWPLRLEKTRLSRGFWMKRGKLDGVLSLVGSHIGSTREEDLLEGEHGKPMALNLKGVEAKSNIFLHDVLVDGLTSLVGARIERTLEMDRSTFKESVDLGGIETKERLIVNRGHNPRRTVFEDRLIMTDAKVGLSLDIRQTDVGINLRLTRAKVTHDVKLNDSVFRGNICLDSAEIGGNLEPTNVTFDADPQKERNRCDQPDAPLAKGVSFVDLTNAKVGKMLFWDAKGDYNIELEGLAYQRLGAIERKNDDRRDQQRATWLDWVKRDGTFTPQPYQQLASLFRAGGDNEGASRALYHARELARQQVRGEDDSLRYVMLSLSKWFIGYGIGFYYLWVLLPATVVIAAGTLISYLPRAFVAPAPEATTRSSVQPPTTFLSRLAFSVHNFLPVVQLEKSFDDVQLRGFARGYFMVHRLTGWILGLFLAAALAGLTQGA